MGILYLDHNTRLVGCTCCFREYQDDQDQWHVRFSSSHFFPLRSFVFSLGQKTIFVSLFIFCNFWRGFLVHKVPELVITPGFRDRFCIMCILGFIVMLIEFTVKYFIFAAVVLFVLFFQSCVSNSINFWELWNFSFLL